MHAADRLGTGNAPHKAHAYTPNRSSAVNHLVARISAQLTAANQRNNPLDSEISRLVRQDPAPQQSNRPFVSVFASQDATYTDYHSMWVEAQSLRDRAATNPALQEAAAAARRRFDSNYGDLIQSVKVRRLAHLVDATNYNVGERLHEFWGNHFNVDSVKGPWATLHYKRVLKSQQCNTFYGLLLNSARHPAMLHYLDNYKSRIGAINENYARELLELHTLGDSTNTYFTQADMLGVARALSGWTWRRTEPSPGQYRARFNFTPSGHDGRLLNLFAGAPQGIRLRLAPRKNSRGNNTGAAVNRGKQPTASPG